MNKPCKNCNKEIFYYAAFCHHCESAKSTLASPIRAIYPVKKIGKIEGTWFGSPITLETLPDLTEVRREYNKKYKFLTEKWITSDKLNFKQFWLSTYLTEFSFSKNNNYESYSFQLGVLYEKTKVCNAYKYEIRFDIYSGKKMYYERYGKRREGVEREFIEKTWYNNDGNAKIGKNYPGEKVLVGNSIHSCVVGKNGYEYKIINEYSDGEDKEIFDMTFNYESTMEQKEIQKQEYYEKRKQREDLKKSFDATQYNKKCTECFEIIKLPAKVCHFCKNEFTSSEVESTIDKIFKELHPEP